MLAAALRLGYLADMVALGLVVAMLCGLGVLAAVRRSRAAMTDDGVDALLRAAGQGNAAALERLLDQGVDVNATLATGSGVTALHGAVMSGSAVCVELLIRRGADLEAKTSADPDGDRDTPLALAVSQACDSVAQKDGSPGDEPTGMVELLLAAGADPEPGLRELGRYHLPEDAAQSPLAELLRTAQFRKR